jgi:uncharacterized membrane protein YedE/YeeE
MIGLLGMFLVGAVLGAVAQRTHFCTMGAIADLVLFGSTRRLRSWLLAIGVAMAGTHALDGLGLIDVPRSGASWAPSGWLGIGLGGLSFGFGMVLAGGCISRNLVRLGAGSLKALLVVLLAGLLSAALWRGPLAGLGRGLAALSPGGLPSPPAGWAVPGLLLALAITAAALADRTFRGTRREVVAGLVIGALVPLTWLLVDHADEAAVGTGLSFAIPTAETLAALIGGSAGGLAAALVCGTLSGSFAMAAATRQLRLEAFGSGDDMLRHALGGTLMGLGGGLIAGCTIGHGLTGLALLAPASFLATAAMVAGAVWALDWLQTGRLVPLGRGGDA